MTTSIAPLEREHLPALRRFLDGLPEGDVTFIKEDVRDPGVAEAWLRETGAGRRCVMLGDDGTVVGLVAVEPLVGWSSHVGHLRLVVDPAHRGRGIGRALTMHALRVALDAGLAKLVVEVVAEQEGAVRMFTDLGFRAEAVLEGHIRDRSGSLRDLLVLAHDVDDEWATMATVGLAEDVR